VPEGNGAVVDVVITRVMLDVTVAVFDLDASMSAVNELDAARDLVDELELS